MGIFNNREIATVIWIVLIFGWALFQPNVRTAFSGVIRAFFQLKILVFVGLMIIYVAAVVAGLYAVHFWNVALLKDTVLWLCFTGMVMAANLVTSKTREGIFRKIVADNVKVIVLIQFLVNTHTFSLVGELVFVPFVTLVAMLETVASLDKRYSSVAKFMSGLQIAIGIVILVFAGLKVISDYENLLTIDALRSLLLAPMLSILFWPFIYLMLLLSKLRTRDVKTEHGTRERQEPDALCKTKDNNALLVESKQGL